ncbi:MAG TPA: mechanosensitive ion channel domain-containing protein [Actinomycetota bacterium]|nr:mechanosensitive ion channel domain-containing protein [Actinomycetota bacterium]
MCLSLFGCPRAGGIVGRASVNGYVYNFFIKLGFSDFAARTAQFIVVRPAKILLIVVLSLIASRLVARAVRRLITSLGSHSALQARSARAPRRANAFASTAASISRFLVWVITVPLILGELGINLGPLIAGATVIGAALGFGAQSLVKDLLSGFLILGEDQYAVGDRILLDDISGIVEDLTLLRTRFRADDGKVWFVANGEVRRVANASLDWVRMTVDIVLPYEADIVGALDTISEEAKSFAGDPSWIEVIQSPPEVFSESMTFESVTLRVIAHTPPGKSVGASRALMERLLRRLRAEGQNALGAAEGQAETEAMAVDS